MGLFALDGFYAGDVQAISRRPACRHRLCSLLAGTLNFNNVQFQLAPRGGADVVSGKTSAVTLPATITLPPNNSVKVFAISLKL